MQAHRRAFLPTRVLLGLLFALAAATLLAACGGDDEDEGSAETGGSEPVVEVQDPGTEPRQELRLNPEEGRETVATMRMDMRFDNTLDGQPLPTQEIPGMEFDMAITVDEATSERIDSTFGYHDVKIDRGADPSIAAGIERTLAGFEDITGTMSTTSSGQLLEADLEVPEGLDPTLGALTTQIEEQFRSITVPFPAEPVGVGATWTVDTELELSGVNTQLHATYTLEQLRGKEYVLATEIEQTIEEGEIEGTPGKILGGDSTGSGEITGRLDSLFPVRLDFSTEGTTTIEVPVEEDDAQELEQQIAVDLTFTSPSR